MRGTRTKGALDDSSGRGVAGEPETSEGGWSEMFGHTTTKSAARHNSGLGSLSCVNRYDSQKRVRKLTGNNALSGRFRLKQAAR